MIIKKILDICILIVIAEGKTSCESNQRHLQQWDSRCVGRYSHGCCYASEIKLHEMTVDAGANVTLPCTDSVTLSPSHSNSVIWSRVREGKDEILTNKLNTQPDGALTLTSLNKEDSGIYLCTSENKLDNTTPRRVKVEVRTPPPALANVTVSPSTVWALLLWDVKDTGGYPICNFSVRYKLKDPDEFGKEDTWHAFPDHVISSSVRQIDVYQLKPNTTYLFKMWATNQLGSGKETILEATTQHDMHEVELARLLLKDAKDFDTRVWVVAVVIVMGTLLILTTGTCYLLYKEYHIPATQRDDQEVIELVPNIILNPGFYDADAHTEHIEPDENSNDQTTTRINNNTIVQPIRV